MISFDEFKQKLPKEAPQKFTARYYGTRALEVFPKEFLNYVDSCKSFIDITAGGGRFTYSQALEGKLVGANDRCFYSYCAMFSVLQHRCTNSDWLKILWDETDPEVCCSVGYRGYFSALRTTHVNDHVRGYVDQICVTHQNDPFVLYCLGKALRSIFTYRGLGWCPATPFGIPSMEVSSEYIHRFLMKTAWTTNLYSERIERASGHNHEVFGADALDAVMYGFSDRVICGSLVYVDPAWPWSGMSKSNPYKWVSEDLSSILRQQSIRVPFWEKNESSIFTEISNWMHSSLNRGAKYFVICNQDTNFPGLERTRDYLSSLTTPKLVKWIEVEDKSKAAHRSYKTAWGILQC